MNTYVAVKDLRVAPVTKRDLLLFDEIVVPTMGEWDDIAAPEDPAERADAEWLIEHGLVSLVDLQTVTDALTEPEAITRGLLDTNHMLLKVGAALDPPGSSEFDPMNILSRIGLRGFIEHAVRATALHLQAVRGISAVPILELGCLGEFEQLSRDMHKVRSFLQTLPPAMLAAEIEVFVKDEQSIAGRAVRLPVLPVIKWIEIQAALMSGAAQMGGVSVVEILLESLPSPDESTPWEQILDFRNDEDSRFYQRELRAWMRKVSKANLVAHEIREELHDLKSRYLEHMRFHKLRTSSSSLQTFLTASAEAVEHLSRLRFGPATKALFSIRERRVALYEAERQAPGREVAYVVQAAERFRI